MHNLILTVRIVLGLAFVILGANYFRPFLTLPKPDGAAGQFMGLLHTSGFLVVVKGIEIAGGLALLSKRFAPLGLLLLGPVVVNIALYDIYLAQKFNPIGTGVAVAFTFLLMVYRKNFSAVFGAPRR